MKTLNHSKTHAGGERLRGSIKRILIATGLATVVANPAGDSRRRFAVAVNERHRRTERSEFARRSSADPTARACHHAHASRETHPWVGFVALLVHACLLRIFDFL